MIDWVTRKDNQQGVGVATITVAYIPLGPRWQR